MKKIVSEFFRRGLIASGLGPVVLAILYLILQHKTGLENLTVTEVCLGIFSLSLLAFIAGGMNVVYKIERLPLMSAILIHGGVLYITYLATYLINNWLEWSKTPILVFSAIFIFSYFVIWSIIYLTIRRNTEKVNEVLKKKQADVTHS
jgi:hypothetical protein